ncbi:glycosyltransferase [Roseovarius sp. SCSIO 43702]|uniref:glycosyltransferase n=1 Tax=Roseovarius sp. SCSIO 43702 TaxID=2823043 RepID=UPI001C733A4B|nr:glycosyltransferase [Roseovarius sp. SCSIO 43702]QYX56874.1 glycosyltransferase [Roseovarius sp. SCSIO 43702]
MAITVLMPVRDGARYLPAQLHSLAAQEHLPHALIVSDDGSRDESRAVVEKFARHAPFDVTILRGPGRGLARNIHTLVAAMPPGMITFCDQDDVWLPHRLGSACAALEAQVGPALHVTARIVTDSALHHRRILRPPATTGFAEALLRNAAPANATVLNEAAAALVKSALPAPDRLPHFPDWWIHALVTGAGGSVFRDPRPGLLYRQHGTNLLGASGSIRGGLRRLGLLFDGRYGEWLQSHLDALDACRALLAPEATTKLDALRRALADPSRHLPPPRMGQSGAIRHAALCAARFCGRI